MREIFWLVSLLKSEIVCVWLLDCILECEWLNVYWTQAIEVRRQDETMSRCLVGNTYDWDFNLGLFISPNVIIVIHIHLHFLKGALSGGIHNWMTWNPACFFSFFFSFRKAMLCLFPFKSVTEGALALCPLRADFPAPALILMRDNGA